jgi:hypothetical protein
MRRVQGTPPRPNAFRERADNFFVSSGRSPLDCGSSGKKSMRLAGSLRQPPGNKTRSREEQPHRCPVWSLSSKALLVGLRVLARQRSPRQPPGDGLVYFRLLDRAPSSRVIHRKPDVPAHRAGLQKSVLWDGDGCSRGRRPRIFGQGIVADTNGVDQADSS